MGSYRILWQVAGAWAELMKEKGDFLIGFGVADQDVVYDHRLWGCARRASKSGAFFEDSPKHQVAGEFTQILAKGVGQRSSRGTRKQMGPHAFSFGGRWGGSLSHS